MRYRLEMSLTDQQIKAIRAALRIQLANLGEMGHNTQATENGYRKFQEAVARASGSALCP